MYVEFENLFERVMFWAMWYGTDAIILFTGIVILLSLIQDHKKKNKQERKK